MDENKRKLYKDKSKEIWTRSLNPYELLEKLKDYIDIINKDKDSYINELRELRDNYDRDAEIKILKQQLDHMRDNSLIILTREEKRKIEEFQNKHYKKCKGHYKFILTPTGLGTVIEIKCEKCSETLDVTDYDRW